MLASAVQGGVICCLSALSWWEKIHFTEDAVGAGDDKICLVSQCQFIAYFYIANKQRIALTFLNTWRKYLMHHFVTQLQISSPLNKLVGA